MSSATWPTEDAAPRSVRRRQARGEAFANPSTCRCRASIGKVIPSNVEILQVCEVTGSSRGLLHRLQILDRADGNGHSQDRNLGRSGPQLLVRGHPLKPLYYVESTEVGLDRDLLPPRKGRGDREGA